MENGILTIDVIRGKRRRKTAHTLALKDLEVIAPNWHESVAKYRKDGGTEKLKKFDYTSYDDNIPYYTMITYEDKEKIKLIYTLHGNKFHALMKVVLPSSIPAIISNMKVNIGLCLVGVIIGEFLAARNGLGYLIIYSSQVFKLDWLLMSIVLLCIMAMGLYALINLLEKWYLKKF